MTDRVVEQMTSTSTYGELIQKLEAVGTQAYIQTFMEKGPDDLFRLCKQAAQALRIYEEENGRLKADAAEAIRVLDTFGAPTLDDGDGGPLSIAGRIDALVYRQALLTKEGEG